MRLDRGAAWSLVPAAVALLVGALRSDADLLLGGAIAAPIALAAALATASRWRAELNVALGGLLVAVLVRFAGLLTGGLAIAVSVAAPMPAIVVLAACLVLGLFIDAVLRSLPVEDPVRG